MMFATYHAEIEKAKMKFETIDECNVYFRGLIKEFEEVLIKILANRDMYEYEHTGRIAYYLNFIIEHYIVALATSDNRYEQKGLIQKWDEDRYKDLDVKEYCGKTL